MTFWIIPIDTYLTTTNEREEETTTYYLKEIQSQQSRLGREAANGSQSF